MIKARKPKKALIQLGIALAIAAVVGVVLILVTVLTIQGIMSYSDTEKQAALAEKEEKEEEVERLRRINKELQEKQVRQEVKALVTIEPNSVITRSMVDLVEVPEATPGAITQLESVVGKRAINVIAEGETITHPKLASPDGLPRVPVGMRAITIKMDYVGGLNGKLIPGALVDVLTTLETEDEVITKTLIQKAQVIAVQDKTTPKNSNAGSNDPQWSVTLAVKPDEAEALALANYEGTFHLTLRNNDDEVSSKTHGVDVAQLLSGSSPDNLVKQLPNPFGADPRQLTEIFVNDPGTVIHEGLPGLTAPLQPGGGHSLEIYRGGSSEVKNFDGSGMGGGGQTPAIPGLNLEMK